MADPFPTPRRFSFDLADLVPAPELRVLPRELPLPGSAELVAPARRPGWLPRLLPVFPAGRPLSVAVIGAASPTFAGILRESLAGIFAAAGAPSGLKVLRHSEGFLCGLAPLTAIEPVVRLVAADLTAQSIAIAMPSLRPPGALLVLNGELGRLEGHLLPEPPEATWRLPLVGPAELETARRGLPAGLGSRQYGPRCLELARELVRRYREAQP